MFVGVAMGDDMPAAAERVRRASASPDAGSTKSKARNPKQIQSSKKK
jgi:hypothetical protein